MAVSRFHQCDEMVGIIPNRRPVSAQIYEKLSYVLSVTVQYL